MTSCARAQSAKEFVSRSDSVMQVRDMFDIVERNYGWESIKIQSPKTYFSGPTKIPKC